MKTGPEVLREIAEAADAKFHDSIDKAMEWARDECRRLFKMRGSHPYPLDLVMVAFRSELHYVRARHNRDIQAVLPEPNMRGGELSSEIECAPAAAHHTTPLLPASPRQPDRAGVSQRSMEVIGQYLSRRIAGTTWGQLYGRQIPALLKNHEAIAGGALKIGFALKKLSNLVGPDDQVCDVVSDDLMGQIFAEADKRNQKFLGQGVALLGQD